MPPPTILVTNDDGVDAAFFRQLVLALNEVADVCAVAPADEQSWIGKAMSRYRDVAVRRIETFPCPAWAVDGTPSDCVNLGIAHLLPNRPDLVVSGINIGLNAGLPLILNSGTVAAALEGALLGIPALALSQHLPAEAFQRLKADPNALDPETRTSLEAAAAISARFAGTLASTGNPRTEVNNLNFPFPTRPDTPLEETVPARLNPGSLYRKTPGGLFRFQFQLPDEDGQESLSDIACLKKGAVSRSVLAFGSLGLRPLQKN